jgi:hypothetical protein
VLISRILRALTLDIEVYEEVEHDKSAIWQAALIVIASSVAAGLGAYRIGGALGLVVASFLSIAGWVLMSLLIYVIGTQLFPESQTRTTVGEVLRVLGFASAPGLFRIFALVPYLSAFVLLIVWVWIFVAMIIAVRQALDFKNTWNAIWVCVVGLIAYWLVYLILLFAYGLPKPIWS